MCVKCILCNKYQDLNLDIYYMYDNYKLNKPTKQQRKYLKYLKKCIKHKNIEKFVDIKELCGTLIYYLVLYYFPEFNYFSGKITGIIIEFLQDNIEQEVLDCKNMINIITKVIDYIIYNTCICNSCYKQIQDEINLQNLNVDIDDMELINLL